MALKRITLANAEFQLDRVASKWATNTDRDPASVRNEIDQILQNNVSAPFGGLGGEKLVNVMEVNLELCKRDGVPKYMGRDALPRDSSLRAVGTRSSAIRRWNGAPA